MNVEDSFKQLAAKFNLHQRPDESVISRRCWGCGGAFVSREINQRYCSARCKAKHKRPPAPQQPARVNYALYLQSDDWKQKAEAAKKRAGWRCQVCNRGTDEVLRLEAHHRTYENLGDEKASDLTVLCNECHSLFEAAKKKRQRDPRNWVAKETKHELRLAREKSDRDWRRRNR